MKQLNLLAVMLITTSMSFAQKDTTIKSAEIDTLKVGNFVIVKKGSTTTSTSDSTKHKQTVNVNITVDNKNSSANDKKKKSNISTNWWIMDLGFANYRDQTNYSATGLAQTSGYIKKVGPNGVPDANTNTLNTGKSSNFNLWFFMQKLNVSKHVLNLKYGLGLEMYNFRYDRSLSYRKDPAPYAFTDSISFSKNKLFAEYLTIPFMVNFNPTPDKKKSFSMSAGVSAGYLIASRNKQISAERGKVKYKGDLGLNPWRVAIIGEIGLGPIRLYGSYSLNTLHKEATGMEQYPYAIGVRFSNW